MAFKFNPLTGQFDVDTAITLAEGATLAISEVTGLTAALAAKQDSLTGTADVPNLDTALAAKQDSLTGIADVPKSGHGPGRKSRTCLMTNKRFISSLEQAKALTQRGWQLAPSIL